MFKSSSGLSTPHRNVNYPGVNVSNATPKIDTGLCSLREGCRDATVDRVMLVDRRKGVVKFNRVFCFPTQLNAQMHLTK